MFEWLKYAYPLNLATLGQCKDAVIKKKITREEFYSITNIIYVEQEL